MSTQDDAAAALAAEGLNVLQEHGVDDEEYKEHLKAVLDCSPDVIIDDGGDHVQLLHWSVPIKHQISSAAAKKRQPAFIGCLPMRAGLLKFLMVDVNNADCKYLFDNRYGTGQSTIDGIMNTTNPDDCRKPSS